MIGKKIPDPWTITITVSGMEAAPRLSVTTREKVSIAGFKGALKVGLLALASLRVMAGPPVCVHR